MKVVDSNGRWYNFPPSGHMPCLDDTRKRSQPHLDARALLKSIYPTQRILEEVPLPGMLLHADFYIPSKNAIVEVHGRQHYEFVAHFHGDRMGFLRSKINDVIKGDWCDLNNILLIILPYDKQNEWRNIIEES